MKNHDEHFMPEQIDEQIEHYLEKNPDTPERYVVHELQRSFTPTGDYSQPLGQIWTRLAQQRDSLQTTPHTNNEHTQSQSTSIQPTRNNTRQSLPTHIQPQKSSNRRPGVLAAAIIAILLVGSALVFFQLDGRRHNPTGNKITQGLSTTIGDDNAALYVSIGNTVSRINTTTHTQRWQFSRPVPSSAETIRGSGDIAIVNGVYYTFGTDSDGYYCYAINTVDGSLRWRYKVHYGESNMNLVGGLLLVANGSVYLSETSAEQGYSIVTALDASTGRIKWQQRYDGTGIAVMNRLVDVSAGLRLQATTNDVLYGITYTGKIQAVQLTIFAINAQNGHLLWRKSGPAIGSEQYGGAQIVDGVLCFTDGQYMYGYDGTKGVLKWHIKLDGHTYLFTSHNGILYIGTDVQSVNTATNVVSDGVSGSIYALRASDGTQLWRYSTSAGASDTTVLDGTVYAVFSHDTGANQSVQTITALNASNGHIRWSQPAPENSVSFPDAPAASKNYLYIALSMHQIAVLRTTDGKLLSTFTIGEKSAPGSIYAATLTVVE